MRDESIDKIITARVVEILKCSAAFLKSPDSTWRTMYAITCVLLAIERHHQMIMVRVFNDTDAVSQCY
jgi:hypothetical protein